MSASQRALVTREPTRLRAARFGGQARVGARAAQLLQKLGLTRDWDLLLHTPQRYRDESTLTAIRDLVPGEEAQVEAVVEACQVVFRGRRQLVATLRDGSGELIVRLLHFFPSHQTLLEAGRRIRAMGVVRGGWAGVEMVHPQLRAADDAALPDRLTPVYPTTEGLPQAWIRRRIDRLLATAVLDDTLPEAVRIEHGLPDLLLAQQLALRRARQERQRRAAPAVQPDADRAGLTGKLLRSLPFALTAAQRRVWAEVERDLAASVPMNRLIQGDVGSGKTVIAALAAARAIESGWQAALMAPTELLAEQHFLRIDQWLAPLGMEAVWLTGRLRAAERRSALQALQQGRARLAIGTHALVQREVRFANLGLAIVDEQHRFGVAQRLALRDAAFAPHLLMLSRPSWSLAVAATRCCRRSGPRWEPGDRPTGSARASRRGKIPRRAPRFASSRTPAPACRSCGSDCCTGPWRRGRDRP